MPSNDDNPGTTCKIKITCNSEDKPLSASNGNADPLGAGDKLGRYIILDLLGEGGMGSVYSAYDPQLDRKVALKLLHTRLARANLDFTARLLQEAKAVAKLSHPNVVTVYDANAIEGHVFISMEFVEGQTLMSWILDEKGHSWQETLAYFKQAGQGLAAAHRAGILHRDFKPENIIISKDGRARVIDFGLARELNEAELEKDLKERYSGAATEETLDDLETPPPKTDTQPDEFDDDDLFGPTVSHTLQSAVAGTPAYMSLEQHQGFAPDSRSDQFSFCVALYYALYKKFPFRGKSIAELVYRKKHFELSSLPSKSNVPRWLHKVVLRGLSPEPKDRFPSTETLLEKLDFDPVKSRRKFVWTTLGVLFLGLLFFGFRYFQDLPERRCLQGVQQLQAVWNPDRKESLVKIFSKANPVLANDLAPRVSFYLDGYAKDWNDIYTESCHASFQAGKITEQGLELRVTCLKRRLGELDALLNVFSKADARIVEKSMEALHGLSPLKSCEDQDTLLQAFLSMPQPKNHDSVNRLRKNILELQALEAVASYEEGLARALQIQPEVEQVDYPPLEVELKYARGRFEMRMGKYDLAVETIKDVFWKSNQTRHDEIAIRSAVDLVRLVGLEQHNVEQGSLWQKLARSFMNRSGYYPDQEARLHNFSGLISFRAGKYSQAEEQFREAIAIYDRIKKEADPALAESLNYLGVSLQYNMKYEEAQTILEKALEIRSKSLGPEHPLAASVLLNLGNNLLFQEDSEKSLVVFKQAEDILKKSIGKPHDLIASAKLGKGISLSTLGQHVLAIQALQEALDIYQAVRGQAHPEVANAWIELGEAFLRANNPVQAHVSFQESLDNIKQIDLPADHHLVAETHFGLGRIFTKQKKPDLAIAHLEHSLKIYMGSPENSKQRLVSAALELSKIHVQKNDYQTAKKILEATIEKANQIEFKNPDFLRLKLFWASVLWQEKAKEQAWQTAQEALQEALSQFQKERSLIAEIQKWLEHHIR